MFYILVFARPLSTTKENTMQEFRKNLLKPIEELSVQLDNTKYGNKAFWLSREMNEIIQQAILSSCTTQLLSAETEDRLSITGLTTAFNEKAQVITEEYSQHDDDDLECPTIEQASFVNSIAVYVSQMSRPLESIYDNVLSLRLIRESILRHIDLVSNYSQDLENFGNRLQDKADELSITLQDVEDETNAGNSAIYRAIDSLDDFVRNNNSDLHSIIRSAVRRLENAINEVDHAFNDVQDKVQDQINYWQREFDAGIWTDLKSDVDATLIDLAEQAEFIVIVAKYLTQDEVLPSAFFRVSDDDQAKLDLKEYYSNRTYEQRFSKLSQLEKINTTVVDLDAVLQDVKQMKLEMNEIRDRIIELLGVIKK